MLVLWGVLIYKQIKFKSNINKNLKKFIQTYLSIGLKIGNRK